MVVLPYMVKSKISNSHTEQGNLASSVGVINFDKLASMSSQVIFSTCKPTYQSRALEAHHISKKNQRKMAGALPCALKVVVNQFGLR